MHQCLQSHHKADKLLLFTGFVFYPCILNYLAGPGRFPGAKLVQPGLTHLEVKVKLNQSQ